MFLKFTKLFLPGILAAFICPSFHLLGQGLHINSGADVVVNGAANIVINNTAFTNSGTFVPGNGRVSLTGTAGAEDSYIDGSTTTPFYDLEINKADGWAKLLHAISVSRTMVMTNKNFDLNGFDLDLGYTGSIAGENENSYIFGPLGGYIISSIHLAAPSAVNPGNMGLEITSAADLGASIIKRGHRQQVTSSGFSINRYFDVLAPDNSELNATVRFFYLNAELAGIAENELQMWGSTNAGSTWSLQNRNGADMTANFVLKNNVDHLNRITLASAVTNALPISLLYFNGQLENNLARLTWATSAEIDNDHFEVQRSSDGQNFQSIATVAGAGSSTMAHGYSYLDPTPFADIIYYRLKQVDRAGGSTLSKVISININALYSNRLVQVYPSPTIGPVSISFTSSAARQVTIQVSDIDGKIVYKKLIDALKGLNLVNDNMVMLPQGTYFITVLGIDDKAFKIFKY